ncbi:MAG: bifunctional precorrin-2 dehydrogenase/sirohydrochlorin ferrochelatase [Sporomusaceae bacterium]|nr:bifunctional precorrin-2 dehydrogenase/sirohydrochlorin ferrochelatase [Sporomusaceae bacterium]
MRYYPVNLDIAGKACLVVGGGAVAERKIANLLAAGAAVTVISPQLTANLAELAAAGSIHWRQRGWQSGDMAGFALAICAANDAAVNAAAATEARQAGVLVNTADAPALCDFTLPALVRRGELLLTISTGGASPILARRIREELEQLYGEGFGDYLTELSALRRQLRQQLDTPAERERFWRLALEPAALELVRQGKTDEAKETIVRAVSGTGT